MSKAVARPVAEERARFRPKDKALPTLKGWQGFTEPADPEWIVRNPEGITAENAEAKRAERSAKKAEQAERKKRKKRKKRKARKKRAKGAILVVAHVKGAPTTSDQISTAKLAHELAQDLYQDPCVRWVRVITPSGKATLYWVTGRKITPREYMRLTPEEVTKVVRAEIPEYEKPGEITVFTVNGNTMRGQTCKDSPRGKTWDKRARAQGLGAYNR
jgi:hypothetical protein